MKPPCLQIGIGLLAVFSARLLAGPTTPPKGPNILYLLADDLSYRNISCYQEAYPWIKTPNIDRLAKRGVRFTTAYIGTWCMPSRATLLTGLLQYGVESMRCLDPYPSAAYDPALCPFWPAVFRKNGYQTAHIGKWHLGSDTGYGRDWDYQYVWNYSSGRPQRIASKEYYNDQMISINGGEPHIEKGYATDNYTRLAADYIRGVGRDEAKPWYLWVCYTAPHLPYTPAARHRDGYPGVYVPDPVDLYPPRPGKPDYARIREEWIKGPQGEPISNHVPAPHGLHGDTLSDWVRQVAETVQALDESVGRLMQVLEETRQLENTLVVFTADQGFARGQHGFDIKTAPYDANLRAPLIFSMPGTLPADVTVTAPVNGTDLTPTFFHFAGIDLPWQMHGHDLSPLLANPGANWPHPVLLAHTAGVFGSATESYSLEENPLSATMPIPWWVFLVKDHYKYIRSVVEGINEELYDLAKDPEELTNLAGDERYSSLVSDMRDRMMEELKRTGAGMIKRLPPPRSR